MADKLNVYKDGVLIESSEYVDGTASVTIKELDPDTNYLAGTYKVSRENEYGESSKIDVPAFKTNPILVDGVTVAPKNTTVEVGSTRQLNSTVSPSDASNKSVTYSSSNEEIATVNSNGLITAVAPGSAVVTVTTQDGSKTDTSNVTVPEPVVNVSSVELTPETVTLDIGDTQQLSANVLPTNASNKNVTYSTGSDAIATVSGTGLVTAVAEGTTDITVTTEDGAKTATSSITVENPEEPVDPEEPEE